MMRLSAIPGLPPLIACIGLLAAWELAARAFDISGLPPAHEALRELPAILTDRSRSSTSSPRSSAWRSASRSRSRSRCRSG
jgi:hypothetical protein